MAGAPPPAAEALGADKGGPTANLVLQVTRIRANALSRAVRQCKHCDISNMVFHPTLNSITWDR